MWKTITSKTIFKHPRISLAEDIVELPDGTRTEYLKYIDGADAAEVICWRDDQILLQREYSYPPNEVLYQFPGGKVEANETPLAAAARELVEEAGLKAKKLELIGSFYMNNRRSAAKLHVYVATGITETDKVGGDAEEVITSHWMPIADVGRLIKNGEIRNYSMLAGWALFQQSDAAIKNNSGPSA